MTLVVPNAGEAKMLAAIVAAQNFTLKLFKSNTTPGESDTAGTYTEATFTGYAAKTLSTGTWNAPVEGAPSYIDRADEVFTSSADQATENVYGYFVVGASDGVIRWAERFSDAPIAITNLNDAITVTPRLEGA